MQTQCLPEGCRISTLQNKEALSSLSHIEKAAEAGTVLEANALLCDRDLNLHVDLGGIRGIIERAEAVWSRDGDPIKDIAIISRVGKPVCFTVSEIVYRGGAPLALLSRKDAQHRCAEQYLSRRLCGDIIPARVTHLARLPTSGAASVPCCRLTAFRSRASHIRPTVCTPV